MKNVEQENIKMICSFYVSQIHLSVMLLPFINSEINEDAKITTVFEELKEEKFNEITNKLNNTNIREIKWIKNANELILNSQKKNTIIIGGKKEYIIEMNKQIKNKINPNKLNQIKIINCYNVEELGNEIAVIASKYEKILNTSGVQKMCY